MILLAATFSLRPQRRGRVGLVILSGVEVSTREGHFLAYGVRNPFSIPRQIGCADLVVLNKDLPSPFLRESDEEILRAGGLPVQVQHQQRILLHQNDLFARPSAATQILPGLEPSGSHQSREIPVSVQDLFGMQAPVAGSAPPSQATPAQTRVPESSAQHPTSSIDIGEALEAAQKALGATPSHIEMHETRWAGRGGGRRGG
ncbi:MAG: GTP-binding protein [Akkermansiaceae bacterium]|nr:GTP-binding protein [Akkermansiaceae bacterium]